MATEPIRSEMEKREILAGIVRSAGTAFFVTQAAGELHGRPMANAGVEDDLASLWFATGRDSGKIGEIERDQKVLLGYSNSSGSEWASIRGSATLVNDRARIKQLWSPMWKNWFQGEDDPNIVLIRVTPIEAEYWDSASAAITFLKLTIAAVTGHKFTEGEHQHVSM